MPSDEGHHLKQTKLEHAQVIIKKKKIDMYSKSIVFVTAGESTECSF
jgi:hypothetical protein